MPLLAVMVKVYLPPELAVGVPEKVPAVPTVNVAAAALLIAGALPTTNVKFCVAAVPMPLFAEMVMGKEPVVEVLPARVAVPLPLSVKVMPEGSAPDSVMAAVGMAVVVTWNVPAVPATKVVVFALVMVGCSLTVMVNCLVEVCGEAVLESLT